MMFEILNRFVEDEDPEACSEWYGEWGAKVGDKYVMDEVKELRDWWNNYYLVEFPKELDRRHEDTFADFPGLKEMSKHPGFRKKVMDLHDFEQSVEFKKLEMMKRLVDISPYLWT